VPPSKPYAPRKLLIAAVGVASINYIAIACGGATDSSSGNPPTSGNLPAPTGQIDSGPPPTSGNLAAPPVDASDDGSDSGDAGDGGDSGDAG
jgi:hypothetical protein